MAAHYRAFRLVAKSYAGKCSALPKIEFLEAPYNTSPIIAHY
jgi:hypothetical protein